MTHWSSRLMAVKLGIANATVARAWRDYGVQPWRSETFEFSTDLELVAKVIDVVGLYLAPPENAIVSCSDEKSQIQASRDGDRTQKMLLMQPSFPASSEPMTTSGTAPTPCSPPSRSPPEP